MKTKVQNTKSGLQNRNEQLSTETTKTDRKDLRLPINTEQRWHNRSLPTEQLLQLLANVPDAYRFAEVVGKWVWVQFSEIPAAGIRQQLAQLGFHWNNTRQTWQHPCGTLADERATCDPRKRYGSYFPVDVKPA